MGRSRRNRARASTRRARARMRPSATLDLCELAQSFPNYLPYEPRIYDDITTPQIARVLRQTKQPLETVALHPHGRIALDTRQHIKAATDREPHRCALAQRFQPQFLSWTAHADKQHIRPQLGDFVAHERIALRIEIAVVIPDDMHGRGAVAQLLCK